ncbi:MAG TPA: beta-galactosidase [Phycisphaerales bacterium]|nr:beta-galactosidase [Phycisphaerales bacterium]
MFLRNAVVIHLVMALLCPMLTHAAEQPVEVQGLPFSNGFVFDIPFDGLQQGTAPYDLTRSHDEKTIEQFVTVKQERFVLTGSDKEIRFWGTNLCYTACFPPHDVSDRLAKRLASLGINIVRFHHMDQRRYPGGIWDRDAAVATTPAYRDVNPEHNFVHAKLDAEALDRMDYLIAQLKRRGIRVNLNLKVSREYGTADGFPATGEDQMIPRRGRGVDMFLPAVIEAQKRYARMILEHVNAYTGMSYAQDPVVAMLEINNENGLVYGWNLGMLDRLPKSWHEALVEQWNQWLQERYHTTAALEKAWGLSLQNQGDGNLLQQAQVKHGLRLSSAKASIDNGEQSGEVESADENRDVMRILVEDKKMSDWRVRYRWTNLELTAAESYVLRLSIRANRQQKLRLTFRRSDDSRKTFRPSHYMDVSEQWQAFEIPFTTPTDLLGNTSQILLGMGYAGLAVEFRDVLLQPSRPTGLMHGEGIDENQQVPWPNKSDLAARNSAFQTDAMAFLRESEIDYWLQMKRFLRDELGCKATVTGTAAGHTTPQIAAASVDFVDTHRYWGGPKFERSRYNRSQWTMKHLAMVNHPATSTIARMSTRRVFGMPFTITEYNHPQPQDYAAEGFPIMAVWGAYQGWQGIFQFAYSHNRQSIEQHGLSGSFFDLSGNPVQLALMPACSTIFRQGAVAKAQGQQAGFVSLEDQLAGQLVRGFPRLVEAVAYDGGVADNAWMTSAIGLARTPQQANGTSSTSMQQPVTWTGHDQQAGRICFTGDQAAGLIGFVKDHPLDLGWIKLVPGNTSLNGFAVVMINAVDGQKLGRAGRYLITAVTRCANRDMGWDDQHTTLGTNWGSLPTYAEAVPLQVKLSPQTADVQLYPLNANGSRRAMVVMKQQQYELQTGMHTLWYELVLNTGKP